MAHAHHLADRVTGILFILIAGHDVPEQYKRIVQRLLDGPFPVLELEVELNTIGFDL